MSKDKISRKDLKENELEHALVEARDYVVSHEAGAKKWTGLAIGAVVLVGLVWGGLAFRGRQLDARLSAALSVFDAPLVDGRGGDASRRDRLQGRRRADRGGEEAASRAGRRLRRLDSRAGGPDDAAGARRGRDASREAPRRRPRPGEAGSRLDRFGVAALSYLEAEAAAGRVKEAITSAKGYLDAAEPPLPKDVLLFTLARLYEKDGQLAEAKSSYQRVVSDYPDSPMRFEAQQKAQGL